jgi:hypothetical protein
MLSVGTVLTADRGQIITISRIISPSAKIRATGGLLPLLLILEIKNLFYGMAEFFILDDFAGNSF